MPSTSRSLVPCSSSSLLRGVGGELFVETPDVGDEVLGQLHPNPIRAGARAKSAQRADGAEGGQRGRCAAGHQLTQQGVQLVDSPSSAV